MKKLHLNNPTGGRLALLTAAVIWGSSFIVMKDTVDHIPVFQLLAIRFTLAGILLALLFRKRLMTSGKQLLSHGAVCGVLLLSAYATQTFGLMTTTPGTNAFLTAVYCVMVPFMAWGFHRKRPTSYNWVAAVLCIAGIGLISLSGDLSIGLGEGLTLLSGVFYALHIMALSHFGERDDPVALTIVQFAVVALLSWAATLLTERGAAFPAPAVWPQLLYLTVFATAATLVLQSVGQSLTPPSQSAILLSLESVFGVLFSVMLGIESLTLQLGCGFALIFVSVIISETQLAFLRRK
ncbi:MAG: DMT family transporter [Clostridia bacterium]|nr:DMT family transporter [Clostridia bacterium]